MLKKLFRKAKFNILEELDDLNINVMPGDSFGLYLDDEEILLSVIDKELKIDRAVIFEVFNELGIEEGIGGAVGKKG